MTDSSEVHWNVDMEVNLFHAMRGHKPAGINRHFQMVSIHERLSSGIKKLSSQDVWDHLSTLYDLRALNESEIVPFPNNEVTDFDFPASELMELSHKSFPRTSYINTPTEHTKAPQDKSGQKSAKLDIKQEVKSSSTSSKSSTPSTSTPKSSTSGTSTPKTTKPTSSSTPASKTSTSTPSSASALPHNVSGSAVEPSPSKRTKRTRNVLSATNSPATPTEPPQKRRR